MAIMIRLFLLAAGILVVTVVLACQQQPSGTPPGSAAPGGGASPGGSASPGGGATPIAPAVEPTHPDAERSIPLPASLAPIAPDIETESRPDPSAPIEPD